MSQSWPEVRLVDVCERITVGHVGPMAQEYTDGEGIPFLRSQNIKPFSLDLEDIKYISPEFHQKIRKSALKPGDIAIIRTGYPGTAVVVPSSLPVSNCADLVIIRPGNKVDPHFIAALFNSTWGQGMVSGRLVGAAQQHFNIGAAKEMRVALPPLPTQRKIAAILSAYDDLIENNTRRVRVLEEMARALYREWFVEYRYPGFERDEFIEDEHGRRPKGWLKTTLGQRARILMGQAPKSEFYNKAGDGLPFHQGVGTFGEHFPKHDTYCTSLARVAKEGDILFSVRAPVGRTNIADRPLVVGRGLSAIRHFDDAQAFTLLQLNDRIKEDSVGNGAIFKAVTKADMHAIDWLEPPAELLGTFEQHAATLWQQLANLTLRNANLRRTRDLLLPRLVSGELDVSGLNIRGSGLDAQAAAKAAQEAVA